MDNILNLHVSYCYQYINYGLGSCSKNNDYKLFKTAYVDRQFEIHILLFQGNVTLFKLYSFCESFHIAKNKITHKLTQIMSISLCDKKKSLFKSQNDLCKIKMWEIFIF